MTTRRRSITLAAERARRLSNAEQRRGSTSSGGEGHTVAVTPARSRGNRSHEHSQGDIASQRSDQIVHTASSHHSSTGRRRGLMLNQAPTVRDLLTTMNLDFMAKLDQSRLAYTLHSAFVLAASLAYCLETVPELEGVVHRSSWAIAEMVFTISFSVELVARKIASNRSKTAFWTDPLIWVDIVSIIPFYAVASICLSADISPISDDCKPRSNVYIRWMQAVKVLRIFKISRHFSGTRILVKVIVQSRRALSAPVVLLMLSTVVFASILYVIEQGEYDPDNDVYVMAGGEESNFKSIVNSAYFVVVTMTTVGYGDQFPKTTLGRGVAVVVMLSGVLFSSMPLAIVGNEYYNAVEAEEAEEAKKRGAARTDASGGAAGSALEDDTRPEHVNFETIAARYMVLGSTMHNLTREVDALAAVDAAKPRPATDPGTEAARRAAERAGQLRLIDKAHIQSLLHMWANKHIRFMRVLRLLTDMDRLPAPYDQYGTKRRKRRSARKSRELGAGAGAARGSGAAGGGGVGGGGAGSKVAPGDALDMKHGEDQSGRMTLTSSVAGDADKGPQHGAASASYVSASDGDSPLGGPRDRDGDGDGGDYSDASASDDGSDSDIDGTHNPARARARRRAEMGGCKAWLYEVLEEPEKSDLLAAWVVYRLIVGMVVLAIMSFTVETMSELQATGVRATASRVFFFVDASLNAVFTLEFVLRLWVAPDRRAFCANVYNACDFLALLPFYLEVAFGVRFIALRLPRMLRIFKLSKGMSGTPVLVSALRTSWRSLLIPLYFLMVFTFVFATLLYLTESGTQQTNWDGSSVNVVEGAGTPSEINGVFRAAWVIIVTMTSVGYGDITPVTLWGRGVATLAMLFGIVYIAMPVAIVGTNFYKAYEQQMNVQVTERVRQIRVALLSGHKAVLRETEGAAHMVANCVARIDLDIRDSELDEGLGAAAASDDDGDGDGASAGGGDGDASTIATPVGPPRVMSAAASARALLPPLSTPTPAPAVPGFVRLPRKPVGAALPPVHPSIGSLDSKATPVDAGAEALAVGGGTGGQDKGKGFASAQRPKRHGVFQDDLSGPALASIHVIKARVDAYMSRFIGLAHVLHHVRLSLSEELTRAEREEEVLATAMPAGGRRVWKAMRVAIEQKQRRLAVV